MSFWPCRIFAVLLTLTSLLAGVPRTAVGEAPTLTSLTLDPTTVTGGVKSCNQQFSYYCWSGSGTVTLSAPAPHGGVAVHLSSNSTLVAPVQAEVTVPAGTTTLVFSILPIQVVTDSITVTISASYGGVTKTAVLAVMPPLLASLALNPASVTGGTASSLLVTLTGPAPWGGSTVPLSNLPIATSQPAIATVLGSYAQSPGLLNFGGTNLAVLAVSTNPVASPTSVSISVTYRDITKTAVLTVVPTAIASLTLNPTSVTGSAAATGTVTLSGPAPPGGFAVGLSSNNMSVATVPAVITVPAGATGATFPVRTNLVASATTVTIAASHAGGSAPSVPDSYGRMQQQAPRPEALRPEAFKTAALGVLPPPPREMQPRPQPMQPRPAR